VYRLGEYGTGSLSLDFQRWLTKMRGKEDPYLTIGEENNRSVAGGELVYSLHNISFEVAEGDAIGIVGRNGAGKSTLLKVLSRITSPTAGRVRLKGRVASLLEVGTGFHPELTGMENIYLNGAIMGMRKKEITKRLDEIVEFSGIGRYIDTPVKRYSSGMYVRLAFAVAAHLESEILIVDEVLAVGDAEFQNKCLGKMGDISKGEGKTVLFVSHNMAAIKLLCGKGLYLQNGMLKQHGNIADIIQSYLLNAVKVQDDGTIPEGSSLYFTGVARYRKIQLADTVGENGSIYYQSPINIYAEIDCAEDVKNAVLDIRISNKDGIQAVHCSNIYDQQSGHKCTLRKGINKIEINIENLLQPGSYSISPGLHFTDGKTLDYVENVLDFEVLKVAEGNERGYVLNWESGMIRLNSRWKVYG
jgi:lipopolysaccharide transport system ATP-binding protein